MFASDSQFTDVRGSIANMHPPHQSYTPIPRNELPPALQQKTLLWMSDRAVAEAFTLVFESQGVQAVSVVSAPAEDRSLFLQSPFSLLLVEPASCYGDAELMEAVRSQRHRVVFFGSEVKAAYVDLAIRSRVRGFVSTQGALAQIVKRVSQLTSGELQEYWCPEAEELIDFAGKQKKMRAKSVFSLLTPRQLEVLTYLAEGKSVKEVAQVMHLSQKSIDSHKYRIMNRLHVHDRVHLSRIAIREGLIEA
uniref:Transcriptional regulator, LuxR family n=2 Tax=Planctomycetaceae TaxID=126 RepID=F0SN59_RUBBR|nr:transcriptional regulator, LuxR family [Rubinisphaera brasiliensis DSM 5305]